MARSHQKVPKTEPVDTNVATDEYRRSVTQHLRLTSFPDKPRHHGWTTINPLSNPLSTPKAPTLASHHDGVDLQSHQASTFRSRILASAELLKWPAGPRKRKKSPTQSPQRPKKTVRVATTRSEPTRVAKLSESLKALQHPSSAPLEIPTDNTSRARQVLLPWNSSVQNANISKKRSTTKPHPREEPTSPSVTADRTNIRKMTDVAKQQPQNLEELDENSGEFFPDDPEDLEDFLEAEKLLTGVTARTQTTTPQKMASKSSTVPRKTDTDLESTVQKQSLPMTPFMRLNFQPRPPPTRAELPTLTGLSTLTRTLTCFRIAEALRLLNLADPSHTLTIELFGVLRIPTWTATDEMADPIIEIADLFFPHVPPTLRLNINPSQMQSLRNSPTMATSQSLGGVNPDVSERMSRNVIRVIIKAWPKTPGTSLPSPISVGSTVRDKFEIKVLRARSAMWEEIHNTRSLVEAIHPLSEGFAFNPGDSTRSRASGHGSGIER